MGKDGKGKYEKLAIAKRILCNEADTKTVLNCQSEELRNDVIKNFHPDIRLGNLEGGVCLQMSELNVAGGVVNDVCRCVMMATYVDKASGKVERLRMHLFNHNTDPTVVGMIYFGNESLVAM